MDFLSYLTASEASNQFLEGWRRAAMLLQQANSLATAIETGIPDSFGVMGPISLRQLGAVHRRWRKLNSALEVMGAEHPLYGFASEHALCPDEVEILDASDVELDEAPDVIEL